MPSISLHISIAWDAWPQVRERAGDSLGAYLFGATLPDIHLMAGFRRQDTHFVDVFKEVGGREVERFFQAYPHLAGRDNRGPTRSLVAGYVCHLVGDYQWVSQIYHPYFGPRSPLAREPLANLLDRTLQYELDRREREGRERMARSMEEMEALEWGEGVGAVDSAGLRAWQGFVLTSLSRPPTYERFPHFIWHYLASQPGVDPEQVPDFLAQLPQRLAWLLDYVSPEALTAFRQEAIRATIASVKEYLE